jgi:hypothetical protein
MWLRGLVAGFSKGGASGAVQPLNAAMLLRCFFGNRLLQRYGCGL